MKKMHLALIVLCALVQFDVAVTLAQSASAQPPKRSEVTRVNTTISIDGILDEPDWAAASSIGEILQREPHPGEKATEKTEANLLFDQANLYIGVTSYNSDPARDAATQMCRDSDTSPA